MKLFVFGALVFTAAPSFAQEAASSVPQANTLKLLWEMREGFEGPESVVVDEKAKALYVSNVAGGPTDKDGKGWISKLQLGGKITNPQWVKGFHAPKGMALFKNTLWVSDIDELVAVDVKKAKITRRIKIEGATFLNDVDVAPDGTVFVTDTLGGKLFSLKGKKVTKLFEGEESEAPNGVLLANGKVYLGGWGRGIGPDFSTKVVGNLYEFNIGNKAKTVITKSPLGNLDGIALDKDGNFIVSDWMKGNVYRVSAAGDATEILSGFKGAADLAIVKSTQVLLVPRMNENALSAYQL